MVATSAEQCRITSPGQRRKLRGTQCARLNDGWPPSLPRKVIWSPTWLGESWMSSEGGVRPVELPDCGTAAHQRRNRQKPYAPTARAHGGTKPHGTGNDLSTQPVGGPRRGAGVVTKGAECPPAREYGNTDTHRLTSEPSVPSSELHVGTRLSTLAARVFELENLNVCERRLDVGARRMGLGPWRSGL